MTSVRFFAKAQFHFPMSRDLPRYRMPGLARCLEWVVGSRRRRTIGVGLGLGLGGSVGVLWRHGWVVALPGVVLKDVGVELVLGAGASGAWLCVFGAKTCLGSSSVGRASGQTVLHVVDHCGHHDGRHLGLVPPPSWIPHSVAPPYGTQCEHHRNPGRPPCCSTGNLDPRKGLTPTRWPHPTRQRSEKHPVPRLPGALSGVSRDHDDTQHEPQRALPQ